MFSLSLSLSLIYEKYLRPPNLQFCHTRTIVPAQERDLPSHFIRNQPFELKVEKWALVHYILFSIKVLILASSLEEPSLRCRK